VRKDARTVFRHRGSINDHLSNVKDEGKRYGKSDPLEQQDVDTLDILPTSQRCETRECDEADESIDLNPCALRPVLVDDGINDESKTIEKIYKR